MLARAQHKMTVEEFLDIYDGVEGKFELVDGVVYGISGGTPRHSAIALAIGGELRAKLRGKPCRAFNSDMALQLDETNVCFPDVAVYCDRRDLGQDMDNLRAFKFPTAIFEVLSPSTTNYDRGSKLDEYLRMPSVLFVALIHPAARVIEVHRRESDHVWRMTRLARGNDLYVDPLDITLTAAEIFDLS